MADRHNRDLDRKPAPLPEALPVTCVDSHAHLEIVTDTAPDSPEVKAVLDEATSVGISELSYIFIPLLGNKTDNGGDLRWGI